jgi:ribosome-associated protein
VLGRPPPSTGAAAATKPKRWAGGSSSAANKPSGAAGGEEGEEEDEWAGEDEEEEDEDTDAAALTAAAAYDNGDEDDDDEGDGWTDGGALASDLAAAADPADASARSLALALAAAAASVKAGDVTVLHVAPLVYWTSYLVLVTVYSRPQLGAVLAKAEAAGAAPPHSRDLGGQTNPGRSAWECLDFGDVVLHALTPAQREFYDLDSFYGAAAEVPVPGEEGGGGGGGAAAAGAGGGGENWARQMK